MSNLKAVEDTQHICKASDPAQELLSSVPDIPQDGDGPVFAEPWQAQAFAMTVALHQGGLFTWPEWASALSREIQAAQAAGDPDLGNTYYQHWLSALERLVIDKGASTDIALKDCADAWDRAAKATPHGKPIELHHPHRHEHP